MGTDGKDLGADIDSILISCPYICDEQASAPDLKTQIPINLYPIPADEYLCIKTEHPKEIIQQISIFDLKGKRLI